MTFANVDNRLTLWIDDRPVFGDGLEYEDPAPPSHPLPTRDDLEPARIASLGAKVRVSDLVLKRDIYYTLDPSGMGLPPIGRFAPAWQPPRADQVPGRSREGGRARAVAVAGLCDS